MKYNILLGLISNENKLNLTAERLNAPVVLNKVNLKGGEAGGIDLFLGQEKFIFLDENKVTDVLKMKVKYIFFYFFSFLIFFSF